MDTQVGNIADLLDNQDELDTPIKRKLNAVGKTLTVIGLIVCVLIFLLGALYHRPLIPQFLVAISLAISIIPEGLPPPPPSLWRWACSVWPRKMP